MSLIGQRAVVFPGLKPRAYWAFAAVAPLARPVRAAVDDWHAALAREGMAVFSVGLAARETLRAELAGLLGGEAASYALVQGTTAGIVALARSLRWRAGERVVTLDDEFPANTIPWRQAAADFGLALDVAPVAAFAASPDAGLAAVEALLARGRVRLVAASAVEFQTGLALPLEPLAELCHRYGALLAVDAIQAAGVVPLDLAALGVDLAVGGGHKWLCATDGAGWVYVAPRARDELGPAFAGWLSYSDAASFLFAPDRLHEARALLPMPRVIEGGSSSTAAVMALLEGVRLVRAAGPAATLAHVHALHDRIEPTLIALELVSERAPFVSGRSGILAARPPEGVSLPLLHAALAREGVVVSIPDGRLRFAPHFASTREEAEHIVDVLPAAVAAARFA